MLLAEASKLLAVPAAVEGGASSRKKKKGLQATYEEEEGKRSHQVTPGCHLHTGG
jgi:hypothetical protein